LEFSHHFLFPNKDYKELLSANITILPIVNQMQISPVMYRPQIIDYFTKSGILIASHKSLHRGDCLDNEVIQTLSTIYSKSPAQIMIKWGLQKQFIVVTKTSSMKRMKENRNVFDFSLSTEDMEKIDAVTKEEDVLVRFEHEMKSRTS
jgi:diketogulonate reductase-like aldo/keto reductase